MKITKRQLKRIIREEKEQILLVLERKKMLNETVQRKLREYYDDYEEEGSGGNNDAYMADFDPIRIQIPAYEEAFPEELQDSPEGKAFDDVFAWQIAEVLEEDEPNIERYDYDEQNEDYIVAKKIWDVAEEAGLDNSALASNIRAATEEAKEAGYNY